MGVVRCGGGEWPLLGESRATVARLGRHLISSTSPASDYVSGVRQPSAGRLPPSLARALLMSSLFQDPSPRSRSRSRSRSTPSLHIYEHHHVTTRPFERTRPILPTSPKANSPPATITTTTAITSTAAIVPQQAVSTSPPHPVAPVRPWPPLQPQRYHV